MRQLTKLRMLSLTGQYFKSVIFRNLTQDRLDTIFDHLFRILPDLTQEGVPQTIRDHLVLLDEFPIENKYAETIF